MPHLYHDRIIKQQQRRDTQSNKTLRDGIVFHIHADQNYCQVKIQGTDQLITAYFNQLWTQRPAWLTIGNSVRIETPEGINGRIEVVGHGFSIPTAQPGGNVIPVPPIGPDVVMAGCLLAASRSEMSVSINVGTYRINGIIYELEPMVMDIPEIIMDRADIVLDRTAGAVFFDAAHATQFRIDVVSVDASGDFTITKGDYSLADPEIPDTPANEVYLGYVLINPTSTVIESWNINQEWGASSPVSLEMVDTSSPSLDDPFYVPWSQEEISWTMTVKDQHGNAISGSYNVRIQFLSSEIGNGALTADGKTIVNGQTLNIITTGVINFTYTRHDPPESEDASSPTFTYLEQNNNIIYIMPVYLLDDEGEIMI